MFRKICAFLINIKSLFYIVLLINVGILVMCFYHKQGFHSDEQWSYAHANSSQGAYLDSEINSFYEITEPIKQRLFHHWIDGKVFHNYLTVQPDEKFNYQNIYHNLEVVEHPPLYFILIHTISSFFPNSFNKWIVGSINILLFILIYIVFFKLALLFLKDERFALCCVALWGFSEIGLATAVFLRMYILQTLLFLCLLYQVSRIISDNQATNKQFALIFLFSFLGILTQYNSIFLSFFVALVSGIFLLFAKNYKLLFKFEIVMALSFLMLFIVFPQAYDVLFHSLRGTQVIDSLTSVHHDSPFMNFLYRIDIRLLSFTQMFCEHFLAFKSTPYQLLAFILIFGFTLSLYFKAKSTILTKWLISIWLLYFFYLFSMPYMHIFHGRYYMCLMPILSLFLIMAFKVIAEYVKIKKDTAVLLLAILIILNACGLRFSNSPYAFTYHQAEQNILANIKGKHVFIDSGNNVIFLHSMTYLLAHADKVFITDNICLPDVLDNISQTENSIVFTYASYIFQNSGQPNIPCLHDIGFTSISNICASQHCYNVWKKNPYNK